MADTTRLLHKRDGVYAALHVPTDGVPDRIGRKLQALLPDAPSVDALFAEADRQDSRWLDRLKGGPRFERGERRTGMADFAADRIGAVTRGFMFFLFDGETWRWAGVKQAQEIAKAETPTEAEVIGMMAPLADEIAAEDARRDRAQACHDDAIAHAERVKILDVTAKLEEQGGEWRVRLARPGWTETVDAKALASMARDLAFLAMEAAERNRG